MTSRTDLKILTKCICPNCKTKHEMMVFWVGKLPARIYCPLCKKAAGRDGRGKPTTTGTSTGGRKGAE